MDIEDENGHIHIKPQGILWFRLLGSDMVLSNCFAAVPAEYAQSSRTDPNPVGFLSHYSEIALILTH